MKKEIQALTQKKENGKMEKERNTGITEIRIIKYMSNKIIEKMDLFYYCTMLVTGLGKLTVLGHRVIHYFSLYNYIIIRAYPIMARNSFRLVSGFNTRSAVSLSTSSSPWSRAAAMPGAASGEA